MKKWVWKSLYGLAFWALGKMSPGIHVEYVVSGTRYIDFDLVFSIEGKVIVGRLISRDSK